MGDAVRYESIAQCPRSNARRGRVHTPHGVFETPAFMPVGTRASVKGVLPAQVAATGAQIVLANTYHLLLRPGEALVSKMGGLAKFMNWPGPVLTDSGGYQAFSMADINTVTDDGVRFKSIIDGAVIELSPERATHVQNLLGADIIMAFDDCPPSTIAATPADADGENAAPGSSDPRLIKAISRDKKRHAVYDHAARLKQANERTVRWLERCKAAHGRSSDQGLFGIVQGGTDLDARTWSASRITAIDLPGYAIGGVAVGETFAEIAKVVRHTAPLLPPGKPRYLMGVGYERDLLAAVLAGVDMFDCVLPTRNARNASVFTSTGQMRLRNAKYQDDPSPIDPSCDCVACAPTPHALPVPQAGYFSRGYLRHLFMVGEMLGPILVTLHNLRHFQRFMAAVRSAIESESRGEIGAWERLVQQFPVAKDGLDGGALRS